MASLAKSRSATKTPCGSSSVFLLPGPSSSVFFALRNHSTRCLQQRIVHPTSSIDSSSLLSTALGPDPDSRGQLRIRCPLCPRGAKALETLYAHFKVLLLVPALPLWRNTYAKCTPDSQCSITSKRNKANSCLYL